PHRRHIALAMILGRYLRMLSLLLALAASTLGVDITIGYEDPSRTSPGGPQPRFLQFKCSGIRPGYCCALPRFISIFTTWELDLSATVRFDHLRVNDIAAVFGVWYPNEQNERNNACSGSIGPSGRGPGTWWWRNPDRDQRQGLAAKGGSYIILPKSLPPDLTTTKWLAVEGILGMLWEDGKWFSSSAAERFLGNGPKASGTWVPPKSRRRRDIRSPLKATVYARPPPSLVYPNLIVVNGTDYTDGGEGNQTYRDAAGVELNLTAIRTWLKS
ncbi:MAG: hypothetical protein Q9181_003666, partial [Wetmoreana brouardii]